MLVLQHYETLQVDPKRVWKGPWRWYHEDMLDCCVPLDIIKQKGITLEQFRCLAICNTLRAQTVKATDKVTIQDFRQVRILPCLTLNCVTKVIHSH